MSDSDGIDSTSLWVGLNNLAPGASVTGSLNLAATDSADIVVNARFAAGNIKIPIQEVLFVADGDGDGTTEDMAAIGLAPEGEPAVGVPSPPSGLNPAWISASPNPFAERTTLRFNQTVPGVARVNIFDVSGRLVRALVPGSVDAGPASVEWDGRDGHGGAVAPGLYFVRVRVADRILNWRLIKLR